MKKLYEFLKLENVAFTLQGIDEAVRAYNISHNWNTEKYISFQPHSNNVWMVNAFGHGENLYFRRLDHQPSYFERIEEYEL